MNMTINGNHFHRNRSKSYKWLWISLNLDSHLVVGKWRAFWCRNSRNFHAFSWFFFDANIDFLWFTKVFLGAIQSGSWHCFENVGRNVLTCRCSHMYLNKMGVMQRRKYWTVVALLIGCRSWGLWRSKIGVEYFSGLEKQKTQELIFLKVIFHPLAKYRYGFNMYRAYGICGLFNYRSKCSPRPHYTPNPIVSRFFEKWLLGNPQDPFRIPWSVKARRPDMRHSTSSADTGKAMIASR